MDIRSAAPDDAERLLAIYAPYVKETAITFEYEVPSIEDFRGRIRRTLETHPYLVAQERDRLVGYAYASHFRPHRAYDWAVETSIYVMREQRGSGVGHALHDALRASLEARGLQNMYACIAVPRGADPYLTTQSVDFHTHLGYRTVGRFERCGHKFDRWYDMIWMELIIGSHPIPAPRLG